VVRLPILKPDVEIPVVELFLKYGGFLDPPGTKTAAALEAWIRRATSWAELQPPKAPGKRPAARQRKKR
jgi:hypothetical protein